MRARQGRTLVLAIGPVLVCLVMLATAALGADPSATPAEVLAGGDLRSEGEGPGLVGNPLLILVAVVGLGLATAGGTALMVRLTRHD